MALDPVSLGLGALSLFGGGNPFGGSGFKRPPGTIGTDQILRLLKQGQSVEDISGMGLNFLPRHQARGQKRLLKAGLSAEDINQLRSPFGGLGAGIGTQGQSFGLGGQSGPASAFNQLLPSILGNQAGFSNPFAASFLSSLFPQQSIPGVQGINPGAPAPGVGTSITPFLSHLDPRFSGPKTPGPSPDPFVGLRALVGPFGNGGGPLVPQFGANNRFRR